MKRTRIDRAAILLLLLLVDAPVIMAEPATQAQTSTSSSVQSYSAALQKKLLETIKLYYPNSYSAAKAALSANQLSVEAQQTLLQAITLTNKLSVLLPNVDKKTAQGQQARLAANNIFNNLPQYNLKGILALEPTLKKLGIQWPEKLTSSQLYKNIVSPATITQDFFGDSLSKKNTEHKLPYPNTKLTPLTTQEKNNLKLNLLKAVKKYYPNSYANLKTKLSANTLSTATQQDLYQALTLTHTLNRLLPYVSKNTMIGFRARLLANSVYKNLYQYNLKGILSLGPTLKALDIQWPQKLTSSSLYKHIVSSSTPTFKRVNFLSVEKTSVHGLPYPQARQQYANYLKSIVYLKTLYKKPGVLVTNIKSALNSLKLQPSRPGEFVTLTNSIKQSQQADITKFVATGNNGKPLSSVQLHYLLEALSFYKLTRTNTTAALKFINGDPHAAAAYTAFLTNHFGNTFQIIDESSRNIYYTRKLQPFLVAYYQLMYIHKNIKPGTTKLTAAQEKAIEAYVKTAINHEWKVTTPHCDTACKIKGFFKAAVAPFDDLIHGRFKSLGDLLKHNFTDFSKHDWWKTVLNWATLGQAPVGGLGGALNPEDPFSAISAVAGTVSINHPLGAAGYSGVSEYDSIPGQVADFFTDKNPVWKEALEGSLLALAPISYAFSAQIDSATVAIQNAISNALGDVLQAGESASVSDSTLDSLLDAGGNVNPDATSPSPDVNLNADGEGADVAPEVKNASLNPADEGTDANSEFKEVFAKKRADFENQIKARNKQLEKIKEFKKEFQERVAKSEVKTDSEKEKIFNRLKNEYDDSSPLPLKIFNQETLDQAIEEDEMAIAIYRKKVLTPLNELENGSSIEVKKEAFELLSKEKILGRGTINRSPELIKYAEAEFGEDYVESIVGKKTVTFSEEPDQVFNLKDVAPLEDIPREDPDLLRITKNLREETEKQLKDNADELGPLKKEQAEVSSKIKMLNNKMREIEEFFRSKADTDFDVRAEKRTLLNRLRYRQAFKKIDDYDKFTEELSEARFNDRANELKIKRLESNQALLTKNLKGINSLVTDGGDLEFQVNAVNKLLEVDKQASSASKLSDYDLTILQKRLTSISNQVDEQITDNQDLINDIKEFKEQKRPVSRDRKKFQGLENRITTLKRTRENLEELQNSLAEIYAQRPEELLNAFKGENISSRESSRIINGLFSSRDPEFIANRLKSVVSLLEQSTDPVPDFLKEFSDNQLDKIKAAFDSVKSDVDFQKSTEARIEALEKELKGVQSVDSPEADMIRANLDGQKEFLDNNLREAINELREVESEIPNVIKIQSYDKLDLIDKVNLLGKVLGSDITDPSQIVSIKREVDSIFENAFKEARSLPPADSEKKLKSLNIYYKRLSRGLQAEFGKDDLPSDWQKIGREIDGALAKDDVKDASVTVKPDVREFGKEDLSIPELNDLAEKEIRSAYSFSSKLSRRIELDNYDAFDLESYPKLKEYVKEKNFYDETPLKHQATRKFFSEKIEDLQESEEYKVEKNALRDRVNKISTILKSVTNNPEEAGKLLLNEDGKLDDFLKDLRGLKLAPAGEAKNLANKFSENLEDLSEFILKYSESKETPLLPAKDSSELKGILKPSSEENADVTVKPKRQVTFRFSSKDDQNVVIKPARQVSFPDNPVTDVRVFGNDDLSISELNESGKKAIKSIRLFSLKLLTEVVVDNYSSFDLSSYPELEEYTELKTKLNLYEKTSFPKTYKDSLSKEIEQLEGAAAYQKERENLMNQIRTIDNTLEAFTDNPKETETFLLNKDGKLNDVLKDLRELDLKGDKADNAKKLADELQDISKTIVGRAEPKKPLPLSSKDLSQLRGILKSPSLDIDDETVLLRKVRTNQLSQLESESRDIIMGQLDVIKQSTSLSKEEKVDAILKLDEKYESIVRLIHLKRAAGITGAVLSADKTAQNTKKQWKDLGTMIKKDLKDAKDGKFNKTETGKKTISPGVKIGIEAAPLRRGIIDRRLRTNPLYQNQDDFF